MGQDREETKLLGWAAAIADGEPVDWERAAVEAPELAESVRALQLVEKLIQAHLAVSDRLRIASDAELRLGRWGRLVLREKLGEGRFGEVFRAFDPALQIDVALKLFRSGSAQDDVVRRCFEEARALARVRHPHVLRVHGVDVHDGRPGIWTELVRGRTLEEQLALNGLLGSAEAARIGADLCAALAACHAAGFFYRDLKTQNVMREEGGRTVLMDFGACELVSPPRVELAGPSYATPLTAAPELLRGEPATPASEVYGLGALLYRLVSGRYPIEAGALEELIRQHQGRGPRPLRELRPDLSPAFVRVVERALRADPDARFSGPAEMERELLAAETKSHGRRRVRRPVLLGSIVLIVAILVGLSSGSWRPDPPPPVPTDVNVLRPADPLLSGPLADASLFLERPGEDDRLSGGERLSVGDALYLEFSSRETLFVYAVEEDERGQAFVLFPLPGHEPGNPLPGGVRHRLPGRRRGVPQNWKVSSPGGREEVLVIATRVPSAAVEEALRPLARAGGDLAATPYSAASSGTRGLGNTESAARAAHPHIERLLRLLAGPDLHGRVWQWRGRFHSGAPQ